MNKTKTVGQLEQLKGKIQKQWGKLTDDDFEQAKGDMNNIKGKIKEKYGETYDDIDKKMSQL